MTETMLCSCGCGSDSCVCKSAAECSCQCKECGCRCGAPCGCTCVSCICGDKCNCANGDDINGCESCCGQTEIENLADKLNKELEEAQDELKRLAAEYKNYRTRQEKLLQQSIENSKGVVLSKFFGIFDDIDRAKQAGELLEGSAFYIIASKIDAITKDLGVEKFAQKGDIFDPLIHEAVASTQSEDASEEIIGDIVEAGYKINNTLLRAAKVVVLKPKEQ